MDSLELLVINPYLLYKLLKISLFTGPKRPRGKSSNCHIYWLARAGRSILVTKFRADVLVPLSHSAARNCVFIIISIILNVKCLFYICLSLFLFIA